jgi:hypothetical protein
MRSEISIIGKALAAFSDMDEDAKLIVMGGMPASKTTHGAVTLLMGIVAMCIVLSILANLPQG